MIKVSDYIMKRLKEHYGVKHVFMVSGGGAMHLNDSVGKYFEYICNHNEQACAIAAEGFARVHQQLGVVNITTGPGGLNCLNGVMGQWTDSVPVLYLSGQVRIPTTKASCPDLPLRQLGDQEVDIISVVKSLTKYAVMVTKPEKIKYHLDKAIFLATHGRFGPVWLDIPLDIQAAMVDENSLESYDATEDEPKLPDILPQVSLLVDLLKKAKRPLIVAGHGIRLANAKEDFLKLVSSLQVPVVTTMNGFDIISDDNPHFIARIGTVANRAGNFVLQNADLVITIGSRNNIRQVSYNWENFAKNADLVCVDIDAAELEKPTISERIKIKIHADCKRFIEEFQKQAKTGNISAWQDWCKKIKLKYPPVTEAERVSDNPIEPYALISEIIEKLFSKDEVIVCGNGTAFLVPFQVGKVKENQRYIWNSGDASMGYDLPAAIGACLAHDKKQIICLTGDGSIMMNLQELQTIKHNRLPIKIIIFNNAGYLSMQQTQNNFFDGRMTACTRESGVSLPDFVSVVKAFDLPALRIDKKEEAIEKLKEFMQINGPAVCEIMVSPKYIFAPKLSAKILPDGTMVSPSLEDLFPFLPENEMKENSL